MPSSDLTALKRLLETRRQVAIQAYRQNLQSDTLLKALRRICDHTIRRLLRTHPLPDGASLAALGGYGRGELYPYSDVDLLILLQTPPDTTAQRRIERLIAAMWDIGLAPSHYVAQAHQCLAQANTDISLQTSLLESRYLHGARPLLRSLQKHLKQQLDPRTFFQAKRAEQIARHAHYQDTPYALEPNCKESPGALRDLQMLLWLAKASGLGKSWRDIAHSGELTFAEQRAITRVDQAFKRLRIELHLLSGRAEDRILFDLQPALAIVYGFADSANRRASEILMQRYYWAARVVTQLNMILMQSIKERLFSCPETPQVLDQWFQCRRSLLELRPEHDFSRNPELIFAAFLRLQQSTTLHGMSAHTLRSLWHARRLVDQNFRQCRHNRQQFLLILQQERGIVHALRLMNQMNILPRYLPVFRRVVGQMQHDLFHAYTVDEHTLKVVRNLRRFTMHEHSHEFSLAHRIISHYPRHWLLYIAAIFHDIAKGRSGNHSELGALDAEQFCLDHELDVEDRELVVFLVREHLSMSHYAQKRDLSDPKVIFDFVRIVGTERRLHALYLLTIADICATNANLWNSWKAKLLEDLYQLSMSVLQHQHADSLSVLEQRKQIASSEIRLQGLLDEARESFWQLLGEDYFLRHEALDIAWHTQQLYYQANTAEPVVKIRLAGHSDAIQVMVYTPDTEGLFLRICRYFDAQHLNIQDARIYTTHHGWALDTFVVLLPNYEHTLALDPYLIEHDLALSLQSQLPSKHQAQPYRLAHSSRARVFPVPASADLQALSAPHQWELAITTTDKHGLLYSLAQVFESHQVSLQSAKVLTLGDRVEDVFRLYGPTLHHDLTRQQFLHDILLAIEPDTTTL